MTLRQFLDITEDLPDDTVIGVFDEKENPIEARYARILHCFGTEDDTPEVVLY